MSMVKSFFSQLFPQAGLRFSFAAGEDTVSHSPFFSTHNPLSIYPAPEKNREKTSMDGQQVVVLPYDITIYSTRPYAIHPLFFMAEAGKKYRFRFHIVYSAELNDPGSYWGVTSPDDDVLLMIQITKPIGEKNLAVLEGILETTKEGNVFPWFMPETAGEKITAHGMISRVEYEIIPA